MPLYASVYMCIVVSCWERAVLLALVFVVYCEFVTLPLVSYLIVSIPDLCTLSFVELLYQRGLLHYDLNSLWFCT